MRKIFLTLVVLVSLAPVAYTQKCANLFLQTFYRERSSVPDVVDAHIDFFYTLLVSGKDNNDTIANCFDKFNSADAIVKSLKSKIEQGYHLEQLHIEGKQFAAIMRNDQGKTFIFRPEVVPAEALGDNPDEVQCISFSRDGVYCVIYKDGKYKTNSDYMRNFLTRETRIISNQTVNPNLLQDISIHKNSFVVVYKDGLIRWDGQISPELEEAIDLINTGDWERNNKYSAAYAQPMKIRYSDRDGRFFIFNSIGPAMYSIF